ncbi:hypothetical protein CCACVL1_28467 [Corchorus capsularis]|uniref:Myb-like domain-containing protein n=1 Tax=Corchorus capsularis TaxID=210143 RepID=A0A1R3G6G1_COCAP|nr:hypothetical protein CCACVL1_28467 [Corchorus capsularis]
MTLTKLVISLKRQDNLEPQQAVNAAKPVKREVTGQDYVNVAFAPQQANNVPSAAKPVKREVTGQGYVNIAFAPQQANNVPSAAKHEVTGQGYVNVAFAPQQVNVPSAAKPVKREDTGQDYVHVAFAPQQVNVPIADVKPEVAWQEDYVNVAFATQQANFAAAPADYYAGGRRIPWTEEEHQLIVDAVEEFIRTKFPQQRVANFRGRKSGLWKYVKQRFFAHAHHRTEQSIHQRFDKLLEEAAKPPIKRLLPMSLNLADRILAVA